MVVGSASGWTGARLKNIATINGRSLGNETSLDYTFRYLEISNVNNLGVISEDAISKMAFEGAPSRARRVVQDGDTVISSVRPNLQAVAFIENGRRDLVASTGFYVVSPLRHKLYEKFAYYILLSDGSRQHFEAVAKGVGYPAVDDKDFGTLKFHLPPFAEQQRIAAYLDKACAAIDGAIRAKRQQLEVLDDLRKSIIHKAVTRGLNEQLELKDSGVDWLGQIPRHWEVKPIKQVAGILNGYAFESECYVGEGGVPIIRISDVENEIIWNEVKKVPEELLERLQRFIINKGDILIALTGATIGKSAVFRSDRLALLNQRVSILRTYAINQDFLSFVIKSDSFTEPVDLLCYGGAQDNIGKGEIGSIKIAVPPPQEQGEITSYLMAKSEKISSLALNLEAQIAVLEQYRKSLIHECVTGKRRIE
jgi:type I restriction enzyme S subunit